MRTIQTLLATTIFLAIAVTPVFAKKTFQTEIVKKVHIQYALQDSDQVVIDNCYGQVHVNTWDRDEVSIDIVVTAKAKNITNAQQILDNINFETQSDKNGNYKTRYKTIIERPARVKNGEMTVEYTINTPRNNCLDISTRYGNIYLTNATRNTSDKSLKTEPADISCSGTPINKSDSIMGADKYIGTNKNSNLHPSKVNGFDKVQVAVVNKQILFISLPAEKRPIWAYITSIYGEIIKTKIISRNKNYIDVRKLPKGTYFVTLVYEGHNRKGNLIRL